MTQYKFIITDISRAHSSGYENSYKKIFETIEQVAEYLQNTTAGFIKCGQYWTEKQGMRNTKLLRTIIKEHGVGIQGADNKIISTLP
jgi:hypothetical protein